MSLHRFFLDEQVLADEQAARFPLQLGADDLRHARALRLQAGEHIAVVDAAMDYFECEVASFDGAELVVGIAQRGEGAPAGPAVTVAQGLAKGDKMETVIRQGTELGVAAFLPLECARSVVRLDGRKAAAKAERWRAVAKSAAMQSGQMRIPEVAPPMPVAQACDALAKADALLVCWEEAPQSASLRAVLAEGLAASGAAPEAARVAVVVGPEGGLAPEEVDRILACNPRARLVSLGRSILRTETAGVVAPALVLYELGQLGGCQGGLA